MSPKRPRLRPKHQWKGHLPGKKIFVSRNKNRPKSKSGKISSNSTKSRPKPSQQRLPEEKEPQRQHRQPGGGAPEPTEPRGHSIPVSIDRQPRGYPRHPGALTEGGHPRPAISPNPRGHPRFDSNSFFGDNFAQEARRRKRSVFRDARPPGQPQQLPDAHRRQQPAVEATPHQVLIHGVHPRIQAGGHDPRLSGKYKLLTY